MRKIIQNLSLIACMASAETIATAQEAGTPDKISPLLSGKGVQLKMPYSKMALTAKLIGPAVSDPEWFNWCVSPIEGKDGKIHIFGSRWPAKDGDQGWMGRNAEIAHFVADKPEGPFRYVQTVLKTSMFPHPERMWAPHNPRIAYVDGKYALLYIYQIPATKVVMQRIAMMTADDLNGPWKFVNDEGGVVAESSLKPDHWTYQSVIGIDNPGFLKIGDNYQIYFKSGAPSQMAARYGVAVSQKLEGPYTLAEKPVTDNIGYIEDAQAFETKGKRYLLTTDNHGKNTGVYGNLILWASDSGTDFKRADAKIAMGNILDYWGTPEDHKKLLSTPGVYVHDKSGKLERPAVLQLKGRPEYLYSTAGVNISGGKVSESYVFKIDWQNGE